MQPGPEQSFVVAGERVLPLIDTAYALMALPNMLATLYLAPRVMRATREYFRDRHLV